MAWTHPDWVRIYRAIDAGWHPDPTICLWFAVYGKRILCFKEKIWYETIIRDVARDIKAESVGMNVAGTFCDPTMGVKTGADVVSLIQIMENEGVPLEPSINDREAFAYAIHNLLQMEVMPGVPRLQLLEKGCPYLAKYLPRMKYDERHPNAMADHKHDHPVVTLAYFALSTIPETRPTESTRVRDWMKPKPLKKRSARY